MNGTLEFYEMQFQWWRCHEVVVTLKPYLEQKNLFQLFAFTGDRDTKTSGVRACARVPTQRHLMEFPIANI